MSLRTLDISWLMITATWKTLGEGRKLSKLKGCNIWLRLRSILDSLTPWPGRSGGCPVNSVPGSTSTRSQKRYEEINVYIYIHFFHKLQFLWFCFLIFLSPSDAIYSSLLSLPLSWVAWVHWRHVSHEAPVAVQLQFLPEPPGVQAIGIGEGARKCKGEYDKKDQQRSKHMQDRQECNAEIWWNDLSLAGLRRKPARFASGALSINLRNLGKPPFSVHLAPWTTTTSTFDIDPLVANCPEVQVFLSNSLHLDLGMPFLNGVPCQPPSHLHWGECLLYCQVHWIETQAEKMCTLLNM